MNNTTLPQAVADCRVLVANGKHNAFPTICKWHDAYWIAYREGTRHESEPAEIVVLRSADTLHWSEAFRVNHLFDNRDAHLVEFQSALWLYFVAGDEHRNFRPFGLRIDDAGRPEPVRQVYRDNFIFWRPAVHNDQIFDAAYTREPERKLELIASENGYDWHRVSDLSNGAGHWSETALHIHEAGEITAYLRFKYSPKRADPAFGQIWRAVPPYEDWSYAYTLPFRIEGPSIADMGGKRYLITRGFNESGSCAALDIYVLQGDEPSLHCSIPCMRDAAYGHAVECEGKLLVVFYATAPDGVNLYLAYVLPAQ